MGKKIFDEFGNNIGEINDASGAWIFLLPFLLIYGIGWLICKLFVWIVKKFGADPDNLYDWIYDRRSKLLTVILWLIILIYLFMFLVKMSSSR